MKKVLKEMIRITRHALILLEQYSFESLCKNKDPHGLVSFRLLEKELCSFIEAVCSGRTNSCYGNSERCMA